MTYITSESRSAVWENIPALSCAVLCFDGSNLSRSFSTLLAQLRSILLFCFLKMARVDLAGAGVCIWARRIANESIIQHSCIRHMSGSTVLLLLFLFSILFSFGCGDIIEYSRAQRQVIKPASDSCAGCCRDNLIYIRM